MLLLPLLTALSFTGAADVIKNSSQCSGSYFQFPDEFHPTIFQGQLYFTPHSSSGSEHRKLLMDNGEVKDPRLVHDFSSLRLTQLTEDDAGTFSVSIGGDPTYEIITLTITDCTKTVEQLYGDIFSHELPTETQYIEFTRPLSNDGTEVVWNRTNPQADSRLKVFYIVVKIYTITQSDAGYYVFRSSDNQLLLRILLVVRAHTENIWKPEHDSVVMNVPVKRVKWTVTFTPKGETETWTVIQDSRKTSQDKFGGRMSFEYEGLNIDVIHQDTGVYTFRDPQGNVGLVVKLDVPRDEYEHKSAQQVKYVAPALGIIALLVIIVWCVKRRGCCKMTTSKRNRSAPQTTAAQPAVYYHDTDQPAGPTSAPSTTPAPSSKPVTPVGSKKPTTPSVGTTVSDVGGQDASPEPDTEQRFEPKGENVPFVQPLGSDPTLSNVYESDKLNFL